MRTRSGAVLSNISLEELRERGSIRIDVPTPHMPFASGTRLSTPSGKIEIESSAIEKLGLDQVIEEIISF